MAVIRLKSPLLLVRVWLRDYGADQHNGVSLEWNRMYSFHHYYLLTFWNVLWSPSSTFQPDGPSG